MTNLKTNYSNVGKHVKCERHKSKTKFLIAGTFILLILFVLIICAVENMRNASFDGNSAITQENFDFVGASNYANENLNLAQAENSPVRPAGTLCDYINENVNQDFTSANQFKQQSAIDVKQTLVDGSISSENPTLDSVWFDSDADAYLTMYDNPAVLYNLDEDSAYAVGYVNTMTGQITDAIFAANNYNGEELYDCIYENTTGLVYVPKTYLSSDTITTQIQTVCKVMPDSDSKVANGVNVSLNLDKGTSIEKEIIPNTLDTELTIPIGSANKEQLSVIANDEQDVTSLCSYDGYNLTLSMSPANVRSLQIQDSEVANLGSSVSATEETMNILPSDRFKLDDSKITPSVGSCTESGDYIQYWQEWASGSPSMYNAYMYGPNGFNSDSDMTNFKSAVWDGSGTISLSNMSNPSTYVLMAMYSWDICGYLSTQGGVWSSPDCLPLKCGHIGTPVSSGPDNSQRSRILAINENKGYAVIGVCSKIQGATKQGGCGTFKVAYESKGGVKMDKDSTCDWAKSNPNYSLANCKFNVYSDENCTQYADVSITTDANGHAESSEKALKKGTYYVKEDASTHGTNYLWNNVSKGKVDVSPNTLTKIKFDNTGGKSYIEEVCKNIPADDPVTIELGKCDAQTGETGVPEGYGDFSNAHYEYKYYPALFQKLEDAPADYERHWVMKTNQYGMTAIRFGEEYKVSGDDFFYNPNTPEPVCPIGTYVITEVKAPEGYELSNIVYIENILPDGSKEYGASSKAYYGAECDTWIENSKTKVMEKVHHAAGDEITLDTTEIIKDPQTGNPILKAKEQVKKGDFQFDKQTDIKGKAPERLTRIPFKVTSTTTGEWHVVVTDNNACVDSASSNCLHTTNTNYFDCLLDDSGNIPTSGIDEQIIDDFYNKSANHAGVWFCFDTTKGDYKKGMTTAPTTDDNNICAMPYDTYILEELPVSKNEHYLLITQQFTIDTHNMDVDLGTLDDPPTTRCTVMTTATSETGEKTLDIKADTSLNDRVQYTGLVAGDKYKLVSWAVQNENGKQVSEKVETEFTPEAENGYEDIELTVNTVPLVGKKITCFEELYDADGTLIAQHKKIGDLYQGVTVKTPTVKTYFYDKDGGKVVKHRSSAAQFTDYIDYTGLVAGQNYDVKFEIRNQKTLATVGTGTTSFIGGSGGMGTARVEMILDTTKFNDGDAIVAYEYIYQDGILIAQHTEQADTNQIIKFSIPNITITTYATDQAGTGKQIDITDNATIRDRVNYINAEVGMEYKLEGSIVDKQTGSVIIAGGSEVRATEYVYPTDTSGSADVFFYLDTRDLKGKELVCYERMYRLNGGNWELCATHESTSDTNQTVTVTNPTITTSLHIKDDSGHVIPRSQSVKLTDEVEYTGLSKDVFYDITGKLVNTDGTDFIDSSGNYVTYEGHFKPDDTGKTEIYYSLDTSNVPDGTQIVSFVTVSLDSKEIAAHKDLTDANQTVTVTVSSIEISTAARGGISQGKELYCIEDESVLDAVSYHGAEGGYEYKLRAQVIDKSTKKAIAPLNAVAGTDYVEKKFIANGTGYGNEEVELDIDTRLLQDKSIVVYEELYDHTGVLRAAHQDINDFGQTVATNQPAIETDLYQKSDNKQVLQRYAEQHLIDSVTYHNLCLRHEYELSGVLMNRATGEVYINEVTNQPVTASYSFVPLNNEGTIDKLEYTFDSTLLPKDTQLVSFVTMTQNGGELTSHCVIDDDRETVSVVTPTLKTKLYDPETGEQSFIACRDKVLNDDYTWTNLPINRVMQAYNWLVNYETGYPVTDGQITEDEANLVIWDLVDALGGQVTQIDSTEHPSRWQVIFTSVANKVDVDKLATLDLDKLSHVAFTTGEIAISDSAGVNTVESKFNYGITPAQKCVAMSVVVSENTVVSTHVDMEDKDESVEIVRSEVATVLSDTNNAKSVDSNSNLMLVDTVSYKNCILGKEYELEGHLISKRDSSVITTNRIKFIPSSIDGETTISFQLDASNLADTDIVAYEYLYLDGDLAASHEDIDDANQTIHINNIIQSALGKITGGVKTGDNTGIALLITIILVLIGCIILATKRRNRIEKNMEEQQQEVNKMHTPKHAKEELPEVVMDETEEQEVEETIDFNTGEVVE